MDRGEDEALKAALNYSDFIYGGREYTNRPYTAGYLLFGDRGHVLFAFGS